jgi:integrase
MAQRGLPRNDDLYLEDGFWKLRRRVDPNDANGLVDRRLRKPAWLGPAVGPQRITKKEAERIALENFPSRTDWNAPALQFAITVADFVEKKFVPEHVAMKKLSGQTHYHAILKHVIRPEEVDRVFHVDLEKSKPKLKAVPDWPYLGNVRLRDVRPDNVRQLISAATARGYSTQTVKHIRNVVGAIFTHARKERYFAGENPASQVAMPGLSRKEARALTLAEAQEVLGVMRYPEREMTLIAILTGMNMAEICGIQWRRVNLTETWSNADGEPIPPRSIAVRKEWYRGELANVGQKSRHKNRPIPQPLLPMLVGLSQRAKFTGPDDFVFVSQAGTPINENNVAARRLKPIGRALHMPWLSWHVIRRAHTTLAYEIGMQHLDRMAASGYSDPLIDTGTNPPAKFYTA